MLLKVSSILLNVAGYDKMTFSSQRAPSSFLGTSDIYKQGLLKEFFKIMQKDPSQMRFTFCTLYSKSKKKNFLVCNFFNFFLQNLVAFGERIPKRYNTWVLTSYFADLEHLNYFVQKMCKKLAKICIHDPNTQVLYLFGILSPNAIRF